MKMVNKDHTAILFDLDGTLIDTKPGVLWSVKNALTDLNLPIPDDDKLTTFMGPPIRLCFTEVCGLDEEQVDDAIKRFRFYYESEGLYNCTVYPGVVELLAKLKQNGFILGVATSKAEQFAKIVLEDKKIACYFDAVAGAPIENHHATKMDSILHVLELLHFGPEKYKKAVLIGDRKFDAEGAALAGIDSIGVTYGYGSREEITEHFASFADSAGEIANLFA